MSNTINWNYGLLLDVKQIRIESSSTFEGPFTTLVTLDFPDVKYVDTLGSDNTYYRMTMIFEDDSESEPTLPKKVMAPSVCRVFGYVMHLTGKPVSGETIRFAVYRPTLPQVFTGFVLDTIVKEVVTGDDGYFEVDLLQGAVVDIQCDRLGLNYKSKVVPALDVKSFDAWLQEA